MNRWLLGALVAAVLVGGIVVLTGGPRESLRAIRDARALAALPQVDVIPMLRRDGDTPDLVVFEDGNDGWFELDTAALPDGLQIGMHGPRMIDMLGGGTHVAVYCGGSGRPGKILWAIRDGQIAEQYGFCNPRRMDLAPLRAFAEPVEMVSEDLTREQVLAHLAEIAADPARAVISQPPVMHPYTARYILTPPLMWYVEGQTPARHEVERAIEARILAHLEEAQLAFRRRPSSNPNLSFAELGVSGMAIRQGDQMALVPGVWGEPYAIWIDCVPESCARIATLDLDGMFDAGRDLAGLRTALRDLVQDPTPDNSPTPVADFPSIEDLEATASQLADPITITYALRYIQRP